MADEQSERVNEPPPRDQPTKRFFVRYPANWDDLTEEEQMAACLLMAGEAQRQLGIADEDDEV